MSAIADAKRSEAPFGRAIEILTQALEWDDPVCQLAAAKAMAEVRAKARADALRFGAEDDSEIIEADGEPTPSAAELLAEARRRVAEHRNSKRFGTPQLNGGGNGHNDSNGNGAP